MAILIILFAISIVAKSLLGWLMSLIIKLCLVVPESFNLFLSEGESAKNAISEPETSPEPISKRTHVKKGVKKL